MSTSKILSLVGLTHGTSAIDHFTVASLFAWPLNESEARGDLAFLMLIILFSS